MNIIFKPRDGYVLLVFLISIIVSAALIATPGYYSNDELLFLFPTASFLSPTGGMNTITDLTNRCLQLGFNLNCINHSRSFRPIGGLILTKVMKGNMHPFWPHLLMSVLHSFNAVLLYVLLKTKSRTVAFLVAVLFAASPLALYTAAWVAAIYDILMTMAGLAMVLAIVRYMKSGSVYALAAVSLFTLIGLLSKETALVFPAVALLSLGLLENRLISKRSIATLTAVTIPWLIYLGFRFSPLAHGAVLAPGGYQTAIGMNVLKNLAAYAEFPFAFNLAEITNVNLLPSIFAALSIAAFLSVFILCWLTAGFPKAIGCLGIWLAPLLPVLVITKFETQYLYASAIGFSMALAICLLSEKKWVRHSGILFAALLAMHSFTIEKSMYQTGICQTTLVNDLSHYASAPKNENQLWPPKIIAAEDAPWWVLARLVGKWEYWHESKAPFLSTNDENANLIMTNACHLRPKGIDKEVANQAGTY